MDQETQTEPTVNTGEKHTLGNYAEVKFTSLQDAKPVKAKVDTGATMSSLHATDVNVSGNTVSFVSDVLSPNKITMDASSMQDIASADGGVEKRPVVKFDVEIDGVPLHDVDFNLNDRTNMDTPILIGQNVLKDGQFVIDPEGGHDEAADQAQAAGEPAPEEASGTSDEVAQKIQDTDLPNQHKQKILRKSLQD